jgi:DNA-binding transcriptional MerR regulator
VLKIGEFSTLTQVSIKTLRHYDELGLLKPVRIDPESGYRYYSASQLPRLHRILALKDLGFPLHRVAGISGSASRGSMLGADLVSESYFRSSWTKPALEMMEARGMAWRFGSDEPEELFGTYGWRATVSQPGNDEANYGR